MAGVLLVWHACRTATLPTLVWTPGSCTPYPNLPPPVHHREMRARSEVGGFEFMPRPSDSYYAALPKKIGDALTPQQYK